MNQYAQNYQPGFSRSDPRNPVSSRQGRGEGYSTSADGSPYTGGIRIESPSPVSTDSRFVYGGIPTPVNSGQLPDYLQSQRGSDFGDSRETNRAFSTHHSRLGANPSYSTQDALEHGAFQGQLPSNVQHQGSHELASGSGEGSSHDVRYGGDYANVPVQSTGNSSSTNTRRAHRGAAFRRPADKPSVKHMTCVGLSLFLNHKMTNEEFDSGIGGHVVIVYTQTRAAYTLTKTLAYMLIGRNE